MYDEFSNIIVIKYNHTSDAINWSERSASILSQRKPLLAKRRESAEICGECQLIESLCATENFVEMCTIPKHQKLSFCHIFSLEMPIRAHLATQISMCSHISEKRSTNVPRSISFPLPARTANRILRLCLSSLFSKKWNSF